MIAPAQTQSTSVTLWLSPAPATASMSASGIHLDVDRSCLDVGRVCFQSVLDVLSSKPHLQVVAYWLMSAKRVATSNIVSSTTCLLKPFALDSLGSHTYKQKSCTSSCLLAGAGMLSTLHSVVKEHRHAHDFAVVHISCQLFAMGAC